MMLWVAYIRENLAGAWAIMLGRPEGMNRLDISLEGFWRSFGVVILILPFASLALLSQRRLETAAGTALTPASGGGFVLEGLALLVDWLAFPLLFALLAGWFGLSGRYVPFIVARNWASVIIGAMVATVHAAHVVGLLPSQIAPFLMLAAIAVALRFAYVIARTTLAISMAMALPIVAFDFLISLTVWSAFDRLTQASG